MLRETMLQKIVEACAHEDGWILPKDGGRPVQMREYAREHGEDAVDLHFAGPILPEYPQRVQPREWCIDGQAKGYLFTAFFPSEAQLKDTLHKLEEPRPVQLMG